MTVQEYRDWVTQVSLQMEEDEGYYSFDEAIDLQNKGNEVYYAHEANKYVS